MGWAGLNGAELRRKRLSVMDVGMVSCSRLTNPLLSSGCWCYWCWSRQANAQVDRDTHAQQHVWKRAQGITAG